MGPILQLLPDTPHGEYITAIEQACLRLEPHNAEELRVAMREALRNSQESTSKITKHEIQALAELKKDQERVILTADKGVAIVIMDKKEYQDKAKVLLEDQGTYQVLKTDPTGRLKSRMINLLKKIKSEGGIDNILYKKLYPTGAVTPKFYGLPKIHKDGIPLRPIVLSRGSITYEVAKELARILKPLVGSSPHHIKNTGDFIQQIKQVKLQADEIITSYDVSALFTSVPIEAATKIIQRKLEQDQQLHQRTSMKVEHITSLLEFFLKTTYFQFQGSFYEQINGAAMGSPISSIVANLFMEEFEVRAIQTAKNPPKMWKRFVDDTCVILSSANKEEFFHHINSIDPRIQFTAEESKPDGSIPYLDCLVTPQEDGSIMTAVYRKPTHTYMYLHWDSYHHLAAKYSVINTLRHRAKTVCTSKQLLEKEEDHLFSALRRCKYPVWAWNKANTQNKQKKNSQGTQQHQEVSHCSGLHERPSRILQEHLQKIWCRSLLQGW